MKDKHAFFVTEPLFVLHAHILRPQDISQYLSSNMLPLFEVSTSLVLILYTDQLSAAPATAAVSLFP